MVGFMVELMVELMPKKWPKKTQKKCKKNANRNAKKCQQKSRPEILEISKNLEFFAFCLHIFCVFFHFGLHFFCISVCIFFGMSSTMNSCMGWIEASTRFSLHPQFWFLGKGQVVGGATGWLFKFLFLFEIDSGKNTLKKCKINAKLECKKNANKTQKQIFWDFQCVAGKESHNSTGRLRNLTANYHVNVISRMCSFV